MDILTKINALEDEELKTLATHSVRFALQHNLIADSAETQLKKEPESPQALQLQQAYALHKDTHNLMMGLLGKLFDSAADVDTVVVEDMPPPRRLTNGSARKAKN